MTITKKIHGQTQLQEPAKVKDALQPEKTAPVLTQDEIAAVDRMVELQKVLTPEILAAIKETDKLKKYLASVALEKFPKEEVAVLNGTKGRVEFSEETHPREIKDMHNLIGALKSAVGGYEKLLPILKVNLGDVDKILSEAERAKYIGDADEGSRKIKGVYPK